MTYSWEPRFWSKVFAEDGAACWRWTGCRNYAGYGAFTVGRKNLRAHRVAWELCVGQIPPGQVPDHLCRNRACVNPSHLELVTVKVNTLRGDGPTAILARKTHCKNNHELTGENLRRSALKRGMRECCTCFLAYQRAWRAKKGAK